MQADLTSLSTCGTCNNSCPAAASLANVEAVACVAGACNVTCNANFDNCNGQIADGCEVGRNVGSLCQEQIMRVVVVVPRHGLADDLSLHIPAPGSNLSGMWMLCRNMDGDF
jgi:hypothetical protein